MNETIARQLSEYTRETPKLFTREVDGQAQLMSSFYEEAPFPGYNSLETPADLVERVKLNPFLEELRRLIRPGSSFLEVGCGTGQLSNFLAASTLANVTGLDASIQSLRVASEFAEAQKLSRVTFVRDDLRDFCRTSSATYDYVWCSGVLHHTGDTWGNFHKISGLVKPDGLIFIGLYNTYGRIFTGMRQLIFRLLGGGKLSKAFVSFFDPVLRGLDPSSDKHKSWLRDQYIHPIESWHSIEELSRHMSQDGFEIVGSVPKLDLNYGSTSPFIAGRSLGLNKYLARATELIMPFSALGREGGLFVLVGRRLR